MPTVEERCQCNCSGCKLGTHCCILDNDCTIVRSEKPLTDEDMLREDEIRASAGLFDFEGLSSTSLNPMDDEQDEDDPWGDGEE